MDQSTNNTSHYFLLQTLIALCVLLNLSGLFITILGPDGTLYATIAKTMVQHNNYIELFARNADWLDKPHLPFWITALFFKIFGFTTWAYKLPGILFLFMGTWYTYLFAKELYNKQIALIAVIILLTAQHIIISNNDVRAEGYLTGFIIASVYYYYKAAYAKNATAILLGSLFAALAVMTKGMFALIPISGAIAGGLIIQKKWKELFTLQWMYAALLILVFILPEIYCLYYQFDLHPDKIVFGRQNVSGIRFFFWDSQFGRFFNTGPIKGSGNIFFFLHTTLWAFLPWSILLYSALANQIRHFIKGYTSIHEWFSISAALLTFLLFSLSKFQLPHYLNIVFPFFSIITAAYLTRLNTRPVKYISIIQNSLLVIVSFLPLAVYLIYFSAINWFLFILLILISLFVLLLPAVLISNTKERLILKTVLVVVAVNLFLNLFFYPSLLKYQSGSEAAQYANKNYKDLPIIQINNFNSALEFYAKQPVYNSLFMLKQVPPKPYLLYVNDSDLPLIKSQNLLYVPLQKFQDYRISRMSLKFIRKATRNQTLSDFYLLLVK